MSNVGRIGWVALAWPAATMLAGVIYGTPADAQKADPAGAASSSGAVQGDAPSAIRLPKPPANSGPTAAQKSGMDTTDPKNGGVAGTGMGGTTNGSVTPSNGLGGGSPADTAGNGLSVSGPAGAGLHADGQTGAAPNTSAGGAGMERGASPKSP